RQVRNQRHSHQFIPIEIHESNLSVEKRLPHPALMEHELRVPVVTRAFTHENPSGSKLEEALSRCRNHHRVSRDWFASNNVNEIRLEKHRLLTQIQVEELKAIPQNIH